MKNAVLLIAAIALLGLGAFYVINRDKTPQQVINPSPTESLPVASSSSSSSSNVSSTPEVTSTESTKTIEMEAGSFYYKPNTITAKKGQKVKIVFNSVSMMHDFNIDELDVHTETVQNGNSKTFEFTPNKAGTFEYYCSVGQHRANGQVGTITIEE